MLGSAWRRTAQPVARHASTIRPRRSPLLVLLTLFAVLVGCTGVAGALAYAKLNGNIRGEQVDDRLGDRPGAGGEGGGGPLNVLLIGSDSREGANAQYGGDVVGARADVTILLHLSADRERAVGVSIPRDTMVQIPDCQRPDGSIVAGELAMFNDAYWRGGSACTIRTMESLTGIRINHHVVVDFDGFKSMVDALGSVEVCVSDAVEDDKANLKLAAGRQEVGGETALAYVRARNFSGGSDLSRIERQQRFLAAMVQKATSAGVLANPARLFGFLDAATRSLTTDPALANLNELRKLAQSVQSIGLDKVEFLTVPWEPYPPDGNRVQFSPDAEVLWTALRTDSPLPGRGDRSSASASPKPAPLIVPPERVRVRVSNGTGRVGLAAEASRQLQALGYLVVAAGPADRRDYATSVVRHGPDLADSARTVAAAIPGARTELVPGATAPVELVLGNDFTAAQQPPPVGAQPSATPTIKARTAQQDVCS